MTADAPTHPVVAAPSPVVPDSDPFGPLSDEDRRRMREFGASGSGVVPDKPAPTDEAFMLPEGVAARLAATMGVPDKPALALIERLENPTGTRCPVRDGDRRCLGDAAHTAHYFLPLDDESNASVVPAVTDDEAATEVMALALNERIEAYAGATDEQWSNEAAASVVADLRSAGFLIVHHTKET
jgi:hypothetical protein